MKADHVHGVRHQFWRAVMVAAGWLALAWTSQSMAHAATQTMPVWLSSGATFAALLVAARWHWPALLAGAGLAAVAWSMAGLHLGPGSALAYGVVEMVSMAAGAWLVTRVRHESASPLAAVALLVGALTSSLVAATLNSTIWFWLRPQAELVLEWRTAFLSTLVGLLLIAPIVLAYRGFRVRRSGGLPMGPFVAGAVAFTGFLATTLVVFSTAAQQRWGDVAATLAYLPMPFLLVASLLWGARGGTVATLVGALLIISRTAHGGGPFAMHESFAGESVIEVQGFITAWVIVLLVTRALAEGRHTALARARDWQLRYERTLHAVGVASVEYDAVTGNATWGEGAADVLGSAVAHAVTLQDWLDLIDPAERGLVQAAWHAVVEGERAGGEQSYHLRLPNGTTVWVRERLAAVRGGDDRVERIVGLLERLGQEPRHG